MTPIGRGHDPGTQAAAASAVSLSQDTLSVEVDLADALESRREVVDADVDPEQPVATPGRPPTTSDLDANEADVAEQWADAGVDDEYDDR